MKEIIIIAGPNGSGKSTLASQLGLGIKFISADDCEKRLFADIKDKSEREQRATMAVAREIQESIRANVSFAFETVFATENPAINIFVRETCAVYRKRGCRD